jgi:hypothetical protein
MQVVITHWILNGPGGQVVVVGRQIDADFCRSQVAGEFSGEGISGFDQFAVQLRLNTGSDAGQVSELCIGDG